MTWPSHRTWTDRWTVETNIQIHPETQRQHRQAFKETQRPKGPGTMDTLMAYYARGQHGPVNTRPPVYSRAAADPQSLFPEASLLPSDAQMPR